MSTFPQDAWSGGRDGLYRACCRLGNLWTHWRRWWFVEIQCYDGWCLTSNWRWTFWNKPRWSCNKTYTVCDDDCACANNGDKTTNTPAKLEVNRKPVREYLCLGVYMHAYMHTQPDGQSKNIMPIVSSMQTCIIHRSYITLYLLSKHTNQQQDDSNTHTHTNTRLTALCPGPPRWAGTRKEKPIWILLKQETVSGSGIHWAICKSAPRFSHITIRAPHHSFLQAWCPSCRPTNSVKALKTGW